MSTSARNKSTYHRTRKSHPIKTYISPSRLRDGKSCVSVAIGLIGAYYTIFFRHDAELFVKREI